MPHQGARIHVDDDIGAGEFGQDQRLGLIGMRERTQILGGHFSVTTAPGAGTLIEVSIPAQQEDK